MIPFCDVAFKCSDVFCKRYQTLSSRCEETKSPFQVRRTWKFLALILLRNWVFLPVFHLGQDFGRWAPVLRQIIVITACFAVTIRGVITSERDQTPVSCHKSKMSVALAMVGFLRRTVLYYSKRLVSSWLCVPPHDLVPSSCTVPCRAFPNSSTLTGVIVTWGQFKFLLLRLNSHDTNSHRTPTTNCQVNVLHSAERS